MSGLSDHLKGGVSTVCNAWAIERSDGVTLAFTDHDQSLEFEGLTFLAQGGMTATTLEQTTGLAVDNAEAVGVLSADGITEADIRAGRFDGARITAWLVNWADTDQREVLFKGSLGEIAHADGQFTAEIRGVSEALNQPRGRSYQKGCSALLGDRVCGLNLEQPLYRLEATVIAVQGNRVLTLAEGLHDAGWFARGTLHAGSGAVQKLGVIKTDGVVDDARQVELWEPMSEELHVGDTVVLYAGCDKRFATCRYKFGNVRNFMGFPDIPGDDWLMRYPGSADPMDGMSRR